MPFVTARRREAPPKVWQLFCQEHLGQTTGEAAAWWQALRRARWSHAVALRSAVLTKMALPHSRQALETLVAGALSPRSLIQATEDLWRERLLTRQHATRLQEAVLAHTNHAGCWR